MAVLYVTEFREAARDSNGTPIPAPQYPSVTEQTVAIGAEADSAAFGAETRFVLISVDAICHVDINADPTATTGHHRMAADTTLFTGVVPTHKISVITGS